MSNEGLPIVWRQKKTGKLVLLLWIETSEGKNQVHFSNANDIAQRSRMEAGEFKRLFEPLNELHRADRHGAAEVGRKPLKRGPQK